MGDQPDLKALFESTLATVSQELTLLERLTHGLFDFYQTTSLDRPAFLRVDSGRTWILAVYPPKPGERPRFRLRAATLTEANAHHVQQALSRGGVPAEITTKSQRLPDGAGLSMLCPVWRVDILPAYWPAIDPARVRLARQHLAELRSFAVLESLTGEFWPQTAGGLSPRWQSSDDGTYRLCVDAFGAALVLEKALHSAGVEFLGHDRGTAREIELLPAYVDRLLQDPALIARARAALAALGARYQMTTPRVAGLAGGRRPETAGPTDTFMGFPLPFPADKTTESMERRRGAATMR